MRCLPFQKYSKMFVDDWFEPWDRLAEYLLDRLWRDGLIEGPPVAA